MRGQRGFTLVELMIVVAVIAVLAAVAIYWAGGRVRSARSSEVAGFFGEFHNREHQYRTERGAGRFLSTGAGEGDHWPAGAPTATARELGAIPATWQTLNIKTPRHSAYCSYVAIAGDGGDDTNVGAKALEFGFVAPAANWYYLLAECNFDGDSGTNSFYFSSSVNVLINEQNPGK